MIFIICIFHQGLCHKQETYPIITPYDTYDEEPQVQGGTHSYLHQVDCNFITCDPGKAAFHSSERPMYLESVVLQTSTECRYQCWHSHLQVIKFYVKSFKNILSHPMVGSPNTWWSGWYLSKTLFITHLYPKMQKWYSVEIPCQKLCLKKFFSSQKIQFPDPWMV